MLTGDRDRDERGEQGGDDQAEKPAPARPPPPRRTGGRAWQGVVGGRSARRPPGDRSSVDRADPAHGIPAGAGPGPERPDAGVSSGRIGRIARNRASSAETSRAAPSPAARWP